MEESRWTDNFTLTCFSGCRRWVCIVDNLLHSMGIAWGRVCDLHDNWITQECEE